MSCLILTRVPLFSFIWLQFQKSCSELWKKAISVRKSVLSCDLWHKGVFHQQRIFWDHYFEFFTIVQLCIHFSEANDAFLCTFLAVCGQVYNKFQYLTQFSSISVSDFQIQRTSIDLHMCTIWKVVRCIYEKKAISIIESILSCAREEDKNGF